MNLFKLGHHAILFITMSDLILDVLITEFKLHDVLKGSEEGFVEVEVW